MLPVLPAPDVDRRFAHPMPPGDFGYRVLVCFPQGPDDPSIAVSRLLHTPLAHQEVIVSSYLGSKKHGQVNGLHGNLAAPSSEPLIMIGAFSIFLNTRQVWSPTSAAMAVVDSS
jgi:hypothetical protein